jgi:hypothetical protein
MPYTWQNQRVPQLWWLGDYTTGCTATPPDQRWRTCAHVCTATEVTTSPRLLSPNGLFIYGVQPCRQNTHASLYSCSVKGKEKGDGFTDSAKRSRRQSNFKSLYWRNECVVSALHRSCSVPGVSRIPHSQQTRTQKRSGILLAPNCVKFCNVNGTLIQ